MAGDELVDAIRAHYERRRPTRRGRPRSPTARVPPRWQAEPSGASAGPTWSPGQHFAQSLEETHFAQSLEGTFPHYRSRGLWTGCQEGTASGIPASNPGGTRALRSGPCRREGVGHDSAASGTILAR
jgi:hypothetical protein